ncbi:hypothetical protein DSLASN_43140 [Desulfoluna limicola]|uniref:TIR domain-containing protein n=1 Tax=Desulfoluna limicola TaxID=2810562 RepID=A0ABM7PNA0_9BACT|nr:toll/interleukin-1 receptor domain-containing protein [Desulfoluna limicola]BCS98682.1 hypothetical protein DSLASN_43140 [Desulfoluna limicola]
MTQLTENARKYLQKKCRGMVMSKECSLKDPTTKEKVLSVWPMLGLDTYLGVMHRIILIEDMGLNNELPTIAINIQTFFDALNKSVVIDDIVNVKLNGQSIGTQDMAYSPRLTLYTNKLHTPLSEVTKIFDGVNTKIDVIEEVKLHKSLFISYGGKDEQVASSINDKIKSKGVLTWFFPDDATPGEKLHRMMFNGVNEYDRVLLICSESSLSRPGVTNEIERVLEREAKEGGSSILIPVTIDDYVYGDWHADRPDIVQQIQSRVITKIDTSGKNFENQIEKIVNVLLK